MQGLSVPMTTCVGQQEPFQLIHLFLCFSLRAFTMWPCILWLLSCLLMFTFFPSLCPVCFLPLALSLSLPDVLHSFLLIPFQSPPNSHIHGLCDFKRHIIDALCTLTFLIHPLWRTLPFLPLSGWPFQLETPSLDGREFHAAAAAAAASTAAAGQRLPRRRGMNPHGVQICRTKARASSVGKAGR